MDRESCEQRVRMMKRLLEEKHYNMILDCKRLDEGSRGKWSDTSGNEFQPVVFWCLTLLKPVTSDCSWAAHCKGP